MKRSILLITAVGLALGMPDAQASYNTTYRAPYEAGPSADAGSGATRDYTDVNTATGEVTVLRANATPGAIGCAARGNYAYLRVEHPVGDRVKQVTVVYEKASITPFTWLKVNVRGQVGGVDQYVGSQDVRGQKLNESGNLIVEIKRAPDLGSTMTIDFGIETASACPNADGGTATFPAVAVS